MFYCIQMCTCCLLKSSCCSPFPQPPAIPLSVFPASCCCSFLLLCPTPVSTPQAAFWPAPHTTALHSQSLATSLLHIQPTLPSKTVAPNSPTKCLIQGIPHPSCSSMLFTLLYHSPPSAALNTSWGGKKELAENSSHGISWDTGVTQRIRAIHKIKKKKKKVIFSTGLLLRNIQMGILCSRANFPDEV